MEEIRDISKADNNHNLAVYLDSAVGNSRAVMSWHDTKEGKAQHKFPEIRAVKTVIRRRGHAKSRSERQKCS